jgi:polar amino acid transport system substrate-binding protein
VSKIVFVTLKPNPPVDTVIATKDFNEVTVLANSPSEALLKEMGLTNVGSVQTDNLNAKKMQAGRSQAWLTHQMRALYTWRAIGGAAEDLNFGAPIRQEHIFIATNLNTPEEMIARLRNAIAEMHADGSYEKVLKKYSARY